MEEKDLRRLQWILEQIEADLDRIAKSMDKLVKREEKRLGPVDTVGFVSNVLTNVYENKNEQEPKEDKQNEGHN